LIALPAIAYLWWGGDGAMVANIVYTVLMLIAAIADNLLKPLLLGRGVEAPMPIVLMGAIGGMIAAGIVGLFVGATVLAVGYVIFMEWVHHSEEQAAEAAGTAAVPTATKDPSSGAQ
jgi:predicted PurR-regulated permease PerM